MSLDLDLQLKHLIEQAPQDGLTPAIMAEVIGPVLKALATQLPRSHYFIVESLSKGLVVTTLRNRLEPDVTKSVIYAFASVEDADHLKILGIMTSGPKVFL
ncbi:MAG: hypothetical protein HC796_10990 [Synechococcaceae cyanobacterium RL_1_2]|nr:hypothetical protein [Synechococcaceae cyanobacterium RL_1_2]